MTWFLRPISVKKLGLLLCFDFKGRQPERYRLTAVLSNHSGWHNVHMTANLMGSPVLLLEPRADWASRLQSRNQLRYFAPYCEQSAKVASIKDCFAGVVAGVCSAARYTASGTRKWLRTSTAGCCRTSCACLRLDARPDVAPMRARLASRFRTQNFPIWNRIIN